MPGTGEPLAKLLAQAAKRKLPPIVVSRFDPDAGEDLLARDRLVGAVTKELLGEPPDLFGRTVMDAPSLSLIEILDAAREVALLSPKRLVLVRGSRLAAGGEAPAAEETSEGGGGVPIVGAIGGGDEAGAARSREADAAQLAALERYLAGPAAAAACILFVGSPWDARRRIHKAFLEAATIVDVSRPDPRAIPAWIVERVREVGGRIDAEAAGLLAEMRGNDTLRIDSEIEKLLLHAGPARVIARESVLALVGAGEAPTAWALVDAMADADPGAALATLRRLMDDGEPAPMVVGAIASRLRQMIVLRDEKTAGRTNEAARKIVFPGRSIFFADALARKAARFAPETLVAALETLYEVDKRSKSSSVDAGAYLEAWLASALARAESAQS